MSESQDHELVKRIAKLAKQNQELEDQIKKLEKINEKLSRENEKIKGLTEKFFPAEISSGNCGLHHQGMLLPY